MREITYSWPKLFSFGRLTAQTFYLGDTKTSVLSDGAVIQFRLIGFNHDRLTDGKIAPMTWQAVDCLPKEYPTKRGYLSLNAYRFKKDCESGSKRDD